jgi:DNA-binding MarR family transcriptional regulator
MLVLDNYLYEETKQRRRVVETQSTPTLRNRDDLYGDAEAVVNQIVRFFRLTKRASAKFSAQQKDGVEQAAYFLLAVLVTEGPQRTTTLADAVHSDTSTVSRQVGALVRHGLVERQADPADGRACLLAATPIGQQCFDQQRRARTEQIADVLQHWTSDDLRTVASLLERLNTDFENYATHHTNTGAPSAVAPKGGTR